MIWCAPPPHAPGPRPPADAGGCLDAGHEDRPGDQLAAIRTRRRVPTASAPSATSRATSLCPTWSGSRTWRARPRRRRWCGSATSSTVRGRARHRQPRTGPLRRHLRRAAAGLRHWTTDLDLRPAQDLVVRVEGDLGPGGLLTWGFSRSIPRRWSRRPTHGRLPAAERRPARGRGRRVLQRRAGRLHWRAGTSSTTERRSSSTPTPRSSPTPG